MTDLPVSFVVAFLILILAAVNHHHLKQTPTGKVFELVLYINALSMVLIGLRWSQGMVSLLPIAAALSITSAALLYLAFRSLGTKGPVVEFARDWWHLVPITIVSVSGLFLHIWIDFALISSKLLYTGLLLILAQQQPQSLQLVRLSWLKNAQQALWGTVILLVISVILDIVITLDFVLYDGRHAENLVGGVSLVLLLLLGWATVLAGRGRVIDGKNDTENEASHDSNHATTVTAKLIPASYAESTQTNDADDAALLEKLNVLLVEERLYADTELNLQRLARKAGTPARIISRTINTQTGLNLSQWVNKARIDAVCSLLKNDSVSISEAMQEAGFLTKSNFNREFRRIKGCSPSQWRHQNSG